MRSIPTCVGFTDRGLNGMMTLTVHPHVRGVYWFDGSASYYEYGPSPRAWGLQDENGSECVCIRSIPTCVGFTRPEVTVILLASVHPHVRGVYFHAVSAACFDFGPSPRAWGLPKPLPVLSRCCTVHPHVRGVYLDGGEA